MTLRTVYTKNKAIYDAIVQIAEENGHTLSPSLKVDKYYPEFPSIQILGNGEVVNTADIPNKASSIPRYWYSTDEFIEILLAKEIQLTSDYKAILLPEGIKVGCQLITYDKLKQLYTLACKNKQL